jgi:3-dehydroquinate dehydratase-1
MSAQKISPALPRAPAIVGTVHSPVALRHALRLRPGEVDLLEIRVDRFARDLCPLLRAVRRLPAPLILTVRHPAEGGATNLSLARRRELYAQFLAVASWIDVEWRSLSGLSSIIRLARAHRIGLIVSTHYFDSTPPAAQLVRLRQRAHRAGADVFKCATHLAGPADLVQLIRFLKRSSQIQTSVMGIGKLGKISRLVLARFGSVLNYGYLGEPQVPGQWEATKLAALLRELDEPD